MSKFDLTVDFFKHIEDAEWLKVETLLADDFRYFGPTPEPVDKAIFLDCLESLCIAFPDWSFHVREVNQLKDKITALVHITGTHTAQLDLSALGLKPIKPTATFFEFPDEEVILTFKGDKLTELHVSPEIHNDLMSLLSHLQIS